MRISEALKETRQNLGLSQKNFIGDIISPSQYSRIENGTQEINLSTVLKLLTTNHVNVETFIKKLLPDYSNSQSEISYQVMKVYYDQDIKQLKYLVNQIDDNDMDLKLRTKLALIYLENKQGQIDSKTKKQIINEFIKREDWTQSTTTLHLLEQSMLIFDFDQISLLMNSIFRKYDSIIQDQSFIVQDRISGICVNYLYVCYQNKDNVQAQKALDLLKKIPKIPELFIYQLLIKYYEALFKGDTKELETVKKVLSKYGSTGLAQNLPK